MFLDIYSYKYTIVYNSFNILSIIYLKHIFMSTEKETEKICTHNKKMKWGIFNLRWTCHIVNLNISFVKIILECNGILNTVGKYLKRLSIGIVKLAQPNILQKMGIIRKLYWSC